MEIYSKSDCQVFKSPLIVSYKPCELVAPIFNAARLIFFFNSERELRVWRSIATQCNVRNNDAQQQEPSSPRPRLAFSLTLHDLKRKKWCWGIWFSEKLCYRVDGEVKQECLVSNKLKMVKLPSQTEPRANARNLSFAHVIWHISTRLISNFLKNTELRPFQSRPHVIATLWNELAIVC